MKRFLTCYLLDPPVEAMVPDVEHPLPKTNWSRDRQKALQHSLSNGYGNPTIVNRDTTFLVNVACDRQTMDQAASWQPQAYQPQGGTFKRLSSVAARAQAAAQQHTQLAPVFSGQQAQQPSYAPPAVYHAAAPGGYQPQPIPAAVTAAAAAAAAAAARNPNASNWTDSRRQLEANLAVEQSITSMQMGPDYLTEHQRLTQRLARLNLAVQLAVGDGNCQFRSVSEQLYGTQEYHYFVRQRAVEHIKTHPAEYIAFLGEDFHYYTIGMAQDGTWGDELTLRAICDSFGVAVHVVTSEQHNWYLRYEPLQLKSSLEVFLTYIAPMHYNSLRRQRTIGRAFLFNFRHY